MLLKVALPLLGAWLLGVAGVCDAGTLVHVLLLLGLMLLPLMTTSSLRELEHYGAKVPSSRGRHGLHTDAMAHHGTSDR